MSLDSRESLVIGMREFCYSSPDLPGARYDAVFTPGVAQCFGIAMYDSDSEEMALIHADESGKKIEQVKCAFETVDSVLSGDFDEVEFWSNENGYQRRVRTEEGEIVQEGNLVQNYLEREAGLDVDYRVPEESVSLGISRNDGIFQCDLYSDSRLDSVDGIVNKGISASEELIVDATKACFPIPSSR